MLTGWYRPAIILRRGMAVKTRPSGRWRDTGCHPSGDRRRQVCGFLEPREVLAMVRLLLTSVAMLKRLAAVGLASLLLLGLMVTATHSQALDPAAASALATSLRMLADPAQRGPLIATDPAAAAIDKQVQSLAGSALAQEVYGLAAEVFADLARNSGGDPKRMAEALEQAKSDPAGFAAMLRPETLQRLRELSTKISDAPR
jgi:hypothetical protein